MQIQNGAIDFIKDFKESFLATYDFTWSTAYKKIYITGTEPTKEEIEMFGKCRF